jgi:outer membrane protein assembly factor BamB
VPRGPGCVVALSGTSEHVDRLGMRFATSPALGYDGMVFMGSSDRFVLALDPGTGATMWTFTPKSCLKPKVKWVNAG